MYALRLSCRIVLHMQCKDWMLREGDSLELMNKLAPDTVECSVLGVTEEPSYPHTP